MDFKINPTLPSLKEILEGISTVMESKTPGTEISEVLIGEVFEGSNTEKIKSPDKQDIVQLMIGDEYEIIKMDEQTVTESGEGKEETFMDKLKRWEAIAINGSSSEDEGNTDATNESGTQSLSEIRDQPEFKPYQKMIKMGLPEGAVRSKMKLNGMNSTEIDKFFSSQGGRYKKHVPLKKKSQKRAPSSKKSSRQIIRNPRVRLKKGRWYNRHKLTRRKWTGHYPHQHRLRSRRANSS